MDVILSTFQWRFELVYLDDVVIFSRLVDQHVDHLQTVLLLLWRAGVSLKLNKCFFFEYCIDYLGHVIQPV